MACIHYKFKSSKEYDSVTFDGLTVSLAGLKKLIVQHRKLARSNDFDLQITNAQTQEVYKNDTDQIPKNASVVVSRIPVGGTAAKWQQFRKEKGGFQLPVSKAVHVRSSNSTPFMGSKYSTVSTVKSMNSLLY